MHRIIVAALLLLVLSPVAALAQQKDTPTPPTGGGTAYREDGQAITTGWNFVHATGCFGTLDGNGKPYLALFAKEGNTVWVTNVPEAGMVIAAACQTGNLVGFHVLDSNGNWNAIFAVPGK